MESKGKTAFNSRLPVVKGIDVASLKEYASLLGPIGVGSFDKTYGNIRKLLQLEVQESVIAALCRFYDSEIRCFIFKNFQMAPTLEEYDRILGFDRSKFKPYQYQGEYYSDEKLAALLQISAEKVRDHKIERNKVFGFPQEYFENLMTSYVVSDDWNSFKQVLALTIFGIVLFPQIERHVSETAIGVFLAFKCAKNPINPVPAILAETYRAFTRHHEFQKNKMCCSFPVLYAWLISHVCTNKSDVKDLLSYALGCNPKTMNSQEWVHAFKNLDALQIRWFSPKCWVDRPSVIFRCGSFQNVPLMGTQGCINYNPSLTLRQLGYPMRDSPSEAMLFRFYLHAGIPKDESLLRRVLQAWETVVRKDREELTRRTTAISFSQWLEGRIRETWSSNQVVPPLEEKIPEPHIPTVEELEEVRLAMSKVEGEKRALQDRLRKIMQDKKKLESENAFQTAAIEEVNRKLEIEGKSKKEMQKHLKGAKEEVKRCTTKMNEAVAESIKWKRLYEDTWKEEQAVRHALVKSRKDSRIMKLELEDQLKSVKQDQESIEGILRDYQQALRGEQEKSESLADHVQYLEGSYLRLREESDYWEDQFAELLSKVKNQQVFEELKKEGLYWKDKFSKLAWLANQAVRDIPKKLRKADAEMNPFNTPVKVCEFVEYCKILTEELMEKAQGAAESKKRKRSEELKAICL